MVAKKKIKDFNNLDNYPDLRDAISKPNPPLPSGSINTKVIIDDGKVVERVYRTPTGELVSLFFTEFLNEAA